MGVVTLVWFLNLFNFMDGIDGIAGTEAVSCRGNRRGIARVARSRIARLPCYWQLLTTAAAGRIPDLELASPPGFSWEMPEADFGVFAWRDRLDDCISSGQLSIWAWLILYGAFFVDATVTLLRRFTRGEPLSIAHRSHAYQRLSRRLGSHRKVTLGYLAVNVVWLAPIAWVAAAYPSFGALLTLVAWAPLAIYSWRCGAGLPGD